MLSGALWRLSLQTNWERDEAHSAIIVAAKWRAIWTEFQSMACCQQSPATSITNILQINSTITQINQANQQLWINAAFSVQAAFFNIPLNFDTDPGDAGGEVAQRDQALCRTTFGFVNQAFSGAMRYIEGSVEEGAALAAGALTLAAPFAFPFVPLMIGTIVIEALFIVEIYKELERLEYRQYIACCMYKNLKGNSVENRDAFRGSIDSGCGQRPQPESAAQNAARFVIETWFKVVLSQLDSYLAFARALNDGMDVAADGLSGCACVTECGTYVDNLTLGLGAKTHLHPDPVIPVPVGINGTGGEWDAAAGESGGGLQSTNEGVPAGGGNFFLTNESFVEVDPACTITEVNFRVKYTNAGGARGHSLQFYNSTGDLVATAYNEIHFVNGNWETGGATGLGVTGATWVRIFEQTDTSKDTEILVDTIEVVMP